LPSTIEQVQRDWRGQGVTVLAVNIQESRERVAAWVREKKLSVRVLLDRDGAVTAAYRVTGTPTVVLIGRDGRMVARGVGMREWAGDRGRALIKALLAAPRG
jgi:peroxiredoxin